VGHLRNRKFFIRMRNSVIKMAKPFVPMIERDILDLYANYKNSIAHLPVIDFTITDLINIQHVFRNEIHTNDQILVLMQIRAKILAELVAPHDVNFNDLHTIRINIQQLKKCPIYVQYIFGQFMESWSFLEIHDYKNCQKAFSHANKLFNLFVFLETSK
jgi:hypothetical protein